MNLETVDRAAAGTAGAISTVEAELLRAWTEHDKQELDGALTRLAQHSGAGSAAATELLLRFIHRSGAVRAIIRRYVSPDEIDDVEQQTLIAVQRSVATFQARSRFMTWLHSVAAHTALAHERAQVRQRELVLAEAADSGDDSGRISSIVVRRADLEAAARTLPPEQQLALQLWDEGHSYEEIAERVGAPVGTVRSRISRARQRLRELMAIGDPSGGPDDDVHDD